MSNNFASIEFAKKRLNSANGTDSRNVQNSFKLVFDALFYSAIAYLFSVIWFDLLIKAADLDYPLTYGWLAKLIITLSILLIVQWPKVVGLGLIGLGMLTTLSGLIFPKLIGEQVFGFIKTHILGMFNSVKWAFHLDPEVGTMPQFFPMYVAVLSIVIAMLLIYVKPSPLLLTVLWILPYIVIVHINQEDISILGFFVGLFCIIITFARQSSFSFSWRKIWQIPPIAPIIVVLALVFSLQAVLPHNVFYNEKLSKRLDQLIKSNQKMPDTVRYFEFSIKDAGFYPQDASLGGPIELTNEPFMNVSGPGTPFYLRGTVFDQFEENIWQASSMESNYMFYNIDPIDQQKEAFTYPEISTLPIGVINNYFIEDTIGISPIYQPVQAVFHGGKPVEIVDQGSVVNPETEEEQGILFYFNPDGQIYASAQITSAGYTVNGYVSRLGMTANYLTLLQNDANVGNLIFADQTISNAKNYRSFLESTEPELARIVYQNYSEQNLRAGQLIEIVDYLKNNFTYSLDVSEVPPNQDFFEYFISTKTGYCTYFATALAVLAREAGFEARYVEGFLVQGVKDNNLPQESYDRLVSTDQAHAWTEIKIEQLGWVSLDATPAEALDLIQIDQEKEAQLRTELPEPTEPDPTATEPTTKPTQTQNIETSQTEALTPEEQKSLKINKTILIVLGILAVIALIIIYILWRRKVYIRRHDPEWLYNKFDGDLKLAVIYIWQDIKFLYKLNNGIDEPHKTILNLFATMLNTFDWNENDTYSAYQAIEQVLYAEQFPKDKNIQSLFSIYQQTEDVTAARIPKLKWLFRRFLFSPEPKL